MVDSNCKVYEGGPAWDRLGEFLPGAISARGASPESIGIIDEFMREAGLVDIVVKDFKLPIGSWGGNGGELFLKNVRLGHKTLAPLYASVFNTTIEEVDQLLQQGEEELKTHQPYMALRVYLGRKP
ncbi:hypothetical protein THASP1DRAFT_24681 [Thamnocephalis sphaerospora]|uniref:S-adenosyl-L-methionine-dependent methyltransferase n=1 Tax=Thamnocephalis sphaerospora TaxID=78915 RepID=A0A4P9XPD1_9FUNG|nr:hypothetical protein THASP1DRAFT_31071 [Thamnocephalis sphaerospora]RKP07117.1 hypothetical protein THASP1DRAFT_24681 [Thamnocephalis sphaerospora]|eukprot:RKP07110.1 hypothetical protein THASP1DRAFT_31071 [Thamnocephalis sphaerospora]